MKATSTVRPRSVRTVLVVCAALTVAASTTQAFAAPSPAAGRGVTWTSSMVTPSDASILGTTRLDAHTTWASGMRLVRESGRWHFAPTVWERDERKGTGWKQLATAPAAEAADIRFNDIDASSPRSALVVGDQPERVSGIVTQSWDGDAWTSALAPVPAGSVGGGFLSVDARTARDAWAAGWFQVPVSANDTRHVGQLQHWDGTRWTQADLPDVGEGPTGGWTLASVAVRDRDDVWAVGGTFSSAGAKPVLLHFDGVRWTKATAPDLGDVRARLNGVAAGPDGAVWAVGETVGADRVSRGLVLRYDGTTWSRVPLPEGTGPLQSVAVSGAAPVVLVRENEGAAPAVLRRTGGTWTSLGMPTGGGGVTDVWDISAYGRTVDVTAWLPRGANDLVGAGMVLTARR
ncbi:hypothetical protein [Streptomyces sp. NPDC020965]|uniref:hypothetical protein n=1 Tax=Streptomyces sp. NPDC020965 TaxID=3365105 RepID=UPI0037960872